MPRIVEHRSALPNSPVVEMHVPYNPECEFPVHAKVESSLHRAHLEPKPFSEILPVADAFLQALACAERAGTTVVWIDDSGGRPDKRSIRDVGASRSALRTAAALVTLREPARVGHRPRRRS
jgi:hypothetical protein